MTFSRDIKHTHYRTPRTVQEAFGAYATYSETVRHPVVREIAEWTGYIVCGLLLGAAIAYVGTHVYDFLFGGW